ncbi:T9SS type A sorting domain-containing protein [Flavivirga abyssicola]|uniref:T9SS type A sorting domain-containing protein n=1 Tax=Flavivirga abyssicola TaxID=3063533 RepID=UPI0026DFF1EB|nr:T9SS type A sorting domain-containing protein [Flavivirga sp. MEBiC07777]WVK11821.1 T9SS type A sorting domain-containing protein [Flavivirga sp. MEBiC07777]
MILKSLKPYLLLLLAVVSSNAQTLDTNYFNALKSSKQNSSPDFEWRQFGPGNSGYCEEFWIHPTDPNCYYMSPDLSNSYGTFDNGVTWQTIKEIDGNGRGLRRVQNITLSHQDPNFGFATNVRGFLYTTNDKGRSWTKVLELMEGRHSEMVVDPSDDNNWYIGAGDFWNVKGYHRTQAAPQGNIDNFIAYGHIYRTDDKGANWTPVVVDPAHTNDLSVGVIVVDPSNSNNIIAMTNFGLYNSTNKGVSWTANPGNGLPHNLPRDMDVHVDKTNPSNPITTLYLVEQTHYTPSGNTVNSTGGVYKSTDFGATWTSLTGNLGVRIASDSNNGTNANGVDSFTVGDKYYRAIAYWLGISKDNAKTTYSQFPNTNVLAVYNRLVVNPANKNEIYVSYNVKHDFTFGPGDVWKTEDGGVNWFPCVRTGKYWDRGADTNYWTARNSPSTVNTTFAHLQEEIQDKEEFSGNRFMEINQRGEVFISIDQQTLKTSDNGATWTQVDDDETSPGSHKWIGRGDSNLPGRFLLLETGVPGRKLLCSGEHGLWQTTDATGFPRADNLTVAVEQIEGQVNPDGAKSISTVAVHPNDPNTIFTLQFRQNHRGYLRKSTDGGGTWSNVTFAFDGDYSGTNTSLDHIFQYDLIINPSKPERMYFCTMGNPIAEVNSAFRITTLPEDLGVKRSFDGGATWQTSNNGMPADMSVRRITLNPKKPWRMYAALNESRNGAPGGLYFSDNSGQFWNKVTIPSAIKAVNNVFVDKTTEDIYISCGRFSSRNVNEGGVWKSADAGATWIKIFDMPYVWQTETSPLNPNLITVNVALQNDKGNNAVTLFNPGAYVSFDGGSTWLKISNNLGQPDVITDLKPDPEDLNVFWLALKGSAWAKGIYSGFNPLLSVAKNATNDEPRELIKAFPNPTTNSQFISLKSDLLSVANFKSISIFNMQGQLKMDYDISKLQTNNSNVKVPIKNLSNGVYLIKININGTEYIKRFIKN